MDQTPQTHTTTAASDDIEAPPDPAIAVEAAFVKHYLEQHLGVEPVVDEHILGPLTALRDVMAICEFVRAGRDPPQPHDRRSLKADVQLALRSLGHDLQRELQPTFDDYMRGESVGLTELLEDRGGVIRLHEATKILSDRLRRPGSSQATWRDLLADVRSGAEPEICRLRVLQLRELEDSLGHEWIWRGRRLAELAGEGKFAACEELLALPAVQTDQLAWFIFANADIPNDYLRVGQVQFFSHRLWPEAVTDRGFMGRFADAEFPDELDDHALKTLKPRHDAEAYVYARVELVGPRAQGSRNPWAHRRAPGEWARDLVAAIVEAATFRVGGSSWKLLSGTALYGRVAHGGETFGSWHGSLSFADPAAFDEIRKYVPPLREGTGEALGSLPPRVAELLAEGDSVTEDAAAEVRWYEATRRQTDPAQRVALHIRAFERALPTTRNERWNDAVKRYFREVWAVHQFHSELYELARDSENAIRRRADVAGLGVLESWWSDDGDRFTVSLGEFFRCASEVAAAVPKEHRLERRALRQVARWSGDQREMRAHIAKLEQRFDTLLGRALRQRNAVVHGSRTVPAVVATVEPFIALLAGFVLAEAVQGASVGDDLVSALEHGRERTRRVLWELSQPGADVHKVLYGVTDAGGSG